MVVLMPSASLETALSIAERIRARVAALDFSCLDPALKVTLSAGVAGTWVAVEDFRVVLKAADRALYRAKREGRNRVGVAKAA